MKQFLFMAAISALLLQACGNNKDGKITETTKNEDGSTSTTSVNVKDMNNNMDEMTKKTEELKKLTPYNLDQLKALLPQEINGIKQDNYNSSSAMGYAFVSGDYKKDDTTSLEVAVYDCAGEAGSGWYAATYWSQMNYQQESSTEYTKTIDFKGGKAIEHYRKNDNESSLTYVANDRLLVVLTGKNMKPDELRHAAEGLNLKTS